ncbi:MAG TPA: porin, partial [Chthoniobacteraceae bacterium]|nr:porin [Chthoniobacteraceae bacterium]
GKTKETANEAEQKADEAAQKLAQPITAVPDLLNAATHNVVLAGDAEVQFGRTTGQHSSFTLADFAPVFLYRANDNILFEAGFDINLQNGGVTLANGQTGNLGTQTSVTLTFAQLDYTLNDYVTIVAGEMLLPLGTYTERNAGWLNKIPDDPLARSVLPESGAGVQLRGAIPVGKTGDAFSYSVYGVNGPGSVDGSGNSTYTDSNGNVMPNLDLGGNIGITSNGNNANLNNNPSGGGRLAYFKPFKPHYDVEAGISGQTGEWDNSGDRWSAFVFDAAVHLSPNFEVKGEYINSWVGTTDIGTYQPHGWWIQGGYKLAGLNLEMPYINNVELVSRYDTLDDGLGTKTQRATAGFIYYFTDTLLLEGDYEWLHSRGPNAMPDSGFVLQLSYGF